MEGRESPSERYRAYVDHARRSMHAAWRERSDGNAVRTTEGLEGEPTKSYPYGQ